MQKTIIQLTTEVPYKELYTFNFLYTPISNSILIVHGNEEYWIRKDNEYWIDEMFDKITPDDNITRFIRVHKR